MRRALERLMVRIAPAPAADASASNDEHALRLATAVLFLEVLRADASSQESERAAVRSALREKFALAEDELDDLYELAEQRSIESHDLYSFTERLNTAFTDAQRLRMLELLWRVAYADGRADDHEVHLLRRIADLLHVRHAEAIGAKLRAERSAGERPHAT